MDLSNTEKKLIAEQEALANLYANPHFEVLRDWMEREASRVMNEMMDERKTDANVKVLVREYKTYKKILGKVSDAFRRQREGVL